MSTLRAQLVIKDGTSKNQILLVYMSLDAWLTLTYLKSLDLEWMKNVKNCHSITYKVYRLHDKTTNKIVVYCEVAQYLD